MNMSVSLMYAVSVETKAKQDFQKLKEDTERKRKDLVSAFAVGKHPLTRRFQTIAKRAHMTKTHQEELSVLCMHQASSAGYAPDWPCMVHA